MNSTSPAGSLKPEHNEKHKDKISCQAVPPIRVSSFPFLLTLFFFLPSPPGKELL